MYWISRTRNVRIRGRIYFENRKNLVFDIGLKTAVIFGQIIFKKWQTAEKTVGEMCVYGEAL